MGAIIRYDDDQRMNIESIKCRCGLHHAEPMLDICVGRHLIKRVPEFIRERELGQSLVLVADETTYALAGEVLFRALEAEGFSVKKCVFHREDDLEPDEAAVGELLMTMEMGTDFFVSVGSGTITDITRIVAAHTERPFVCVGTAPSMDGYTSVVAPLIKGGVKVNLPATCPEIIVCDLDILRTAPARMFAAGVGDVLGKYIAAADWRIGSIVNGEVYCPACGEMVLRAADQLLDNIEKIRERSEEGTRILIEALLIAGLTIMIVGHTRAVASIEHNIAHYWEMQKLARAEKPASHGAAVGVATALVWPYYEKFLSLNLDGIDEKVVISTAMSRDERIAYMREYYGDAAAEAIMADNEGDFLSEEEQARRIRAIKEKKDKIDQVIRDMPDGQRIIKALQTIGAPVKPAEIGIDEDLTERALCCAKDYRTRYTLFKSTEELGIPFVGRQPAER